MHTPDTLLAQALDETGIVLTEEQQALLVRHLLLVVDRNKTLNLTRVTSLHEAVYLHVVDSLLLLDAFRAAPEGSFVDVGTGAGYPGIPLAVATGRHAVLVDSVGKKAKAVREFVHELRLTDRIDVHACRIEELARRQRGRHAIVTARAVAQTNVLVEYAAPLLSRGGRLVVAKARPSDEELELGDRAARICGLQRVSRETYELPHDLGHREVLSYERVGNPSIRLPRNVGMAQHHPLG